MKKDKMLEISNEISAQLAVELTRKEVRQLAKKTKKLLKGIKKLKQTTSV